MQNKKYYFTILATLLFTWFFTWASAFSLIPIWLNHVKSLSGSEIGVFFTLQSVTALCVQPFYGYIQDKLGLKKNLILVTGLILAGVGPFYLFVVSPVIESHHYVGAMLGGAYFGLALSAGVGVIESYIERVSRLVGFEYGKCRSFGSIGYAAGTFLAGYVFGINPDLNFWLAFASGSIFLACVALLKPLKLNAYNTLAMGSPEKIKLADALALLQMSRTWYLILYIAGVSLYNVYDQQFAIYFARQFETPEAGNAAFGYLNSAQVFLESGMMFVAPWIISKIGVKNGMLLAGAIMSFRIIGSGLVEGPVLITIMKMLHGLELPLLLVAKWKYITSRFDPRLSATLFIVAFQFTTQIFATLLSFFVGGLYSTIGFAHAYIALGTVAGVIFAISGFYLISDKQTAAEKKEAH